MSLGSTVGSVLGGIIGTAVGPEGTAAGAMIGRAVGGAVGGEAENAVKGGMHHMGAPGAATLAGGPEGSVARMNSALSGAQFR